MLYYSILIRKRNIQRSSISGLGWRSLPKKPKSRRLAFNQCQNATLSVLFQMTGGWEIKRQEIDQPIQTTYNRGRQGASRSCQHGTSLTCPGCVTLRFFFGKFWPPSKWTSGTVMDVGEDDMVKLIIDFTMHVFADAGLRCLTEGRPCRWRMAKHHGRFLQPRAAWDWMWYTYMSTEENA